MSKRDRQIQDPFEQHQDAAEPITRPEPESFTYQKITWTAKDDIAPIDDAPVVDDTPESSAITLNFTKIEVADHASPLQQDGGSTEQALCNNENITADVVAEAVDAGLADSPLGQQPAGDGYLVITMENVVDDALDG